MTLKSDHLGGIFRPALCWFHYYLIHRGHRLYQKMLECKKCGLFFLWKTGYWYFYCHRTICLPSKNFVYCRFPISCNVNFKETALFENNMHISHVVQIFSFRPGEHVTNSFLGVSVNCVSTEWTFLK